MPKKDLLKSPSNVCVVGLDLSLTSTGVVVLRGEKIVLQEVVRSVPVGPLPIDEAKRLDGIANMVLALVPDDADLVAIEGIAFMISKTTSLVQLAAINFIIRIGLWKRGIKFVIVSPPTLKKFVTGKGVAQKDEMILSIYKQYGHTILDNNKADAFSLAAVACAVINKPIIKLGVPQLEVVGLLKKQT